MELHVFADKNGADAIAPGTYTGRTAPFFKMLVVQKQSARSAVEGDECCRDSGHDAVVVLL